MITIITEMTDEELFKTYWMPLICRHREIKFIFAKTGELKHPPMKDWSNVLFAPTKSLEEVIEHYNSGGKFSSTVDPLMKKQGVGLQLSNQEKIDLIAYLKTLSDYNFIEDNN